MTQHAMLMPTKITKRVLSWSYNVTDSPATEVRIDYAYTDEAGVDRYAVRVPGGYCITRDSDLVPDESAVDKDEAWLDAHRIPLDEAELLASTEARYRGYEFETGF